MDSSLRVTEVSKRFGATQALESVTLSFESGEIHAVIGENGAGKSTLIGLLNGKYRLDSGEISRPKGGKMGVVHQHFMLAPALTVAENLLLASPERSLILQKSELNSIEQVFQKLGWKFEPNRKVSELSVGEQQRLEIAKALLTDPQIVILDEPTAVLAEHEVDGLFDVLRELKQAGKIVILVAHKLSEVLSIADRVSVLRMGRMVGTVARKDADVAILSQWMVGAEVPPASLFSPTDMEVVVRSNGLTVADDRGLSAITNLSFEIRRGEIFGIGGVDGNGQLELAEAMAGIRPAHSGDINWPKGSHGYIPQDRQRDGLVLDFSVGENLMLESSEPSLYSKGWFRPAVWATWCSRLIQEFRIKAESHRTPTSSLSGGNQQKVVAARELSEKPSFLVAMNPTRGLDVRSAEDVRGHLVRIAQEGAAILLISTDADELRQISHRTAFLSRGRLYESLAEAVASP